MTTPNQSVSVRRTLYAAQIEPIEPILYDSQYDSILDDVLDDVLMYDPSYNINGYVWDGIRHVMESEVVINQFILFMGDSKTDSSFPSIMLDTMNLTTPSEYLWNESTPRHAFGGWKIDDLRVFTLANIDNLDNVPNYALVNIGINDWEVWDTGLESAWKEDLQDIITSVHTKFPRCQVYVMRPWAENETIARLLQYANLFEWIDEIVSLNSSYCYLGPNEADFLSGLTSDEFHPTDPEGYQATANAWKTVIGY